MNIFRPILSITTFIFIVSGCVSPANDPSLNSTEQSSTSNPRLDEPYSLSDTIKSRSISFENITGAVGAGGQAASPLGKGRKGAPSRVFDPGETVELANIEGTGTIRHMWMTLPERPEILRSMVIRVYWDGQETPSIEAPVGDFFGFAHGTSPAFQNAVHSVGEKAGMNIWLPMPFLENARITLTNELNYPMMVYYQIDYTIGEHHDEDIGRLHVSFQRSNPTAIKEDFEIMPHRVGKGRFIGTVIGVRPIPSGVSAGEDWWGEGEVKMFLDGDEEYATITGTGAEDYVGLSYGIQQTPFMYHGANNVSKDEDGVEKYISMYRWHLPDPIYWSEDIRVTIQQMGCCKNEVPPVAELVTNWMEWYMNTLFERQDDWSAATFWYEPTPSARLPDMPNRAARIADLPPPPELK